MGATTGAIRQSTGAEPTIIVTESGDRRQALSCRGEIDS
jgi:hypothetical protein